MSIGVLYFCPTCGRMLADEADGPCDDCLNFGEGCVVMPQVPQRVERKPKPSWMTRRPQSRAKTAESEAK